MFERLQQLWDRCQLNSNQLSLVWALPIINVALVLLVIVGISWSAIGLLRQMADDEGISRVQLAGSLARDELHRLSERLLSEGRVLAAHPAWRRTATLSSGELATVLQHNGRIKNDLAKSHASIAVLTDTAVITGGDSQLDWQVIRAAANEQGERFFVAATLHHPALMGAAMSLQSPHATVRLVVVRFLDATLATELAERAGLRVRLMDYRAVSTQPSDALTRLHSAALSDGRYAAARLTALGIFAASVPVFAVNGAAVTLIVTELPVEDIDATVHARIKHLVLTAVVVALLAVLASIFLVRQVVGPVRALTDAALRLGEGDFSTSIPTEGTAEVAALSNTMEGMRRNFVALTTTLRRREAEAQAVLTGIVEGVYAVDRARRIRYLNPQAARLLGVTAEQVVGQFCGDVLQPSLSAEGRKPCDFNCPILLARHAGHAQATEQLTTATGAVRVAVITSADLIDDMQVQVIRDETPLETARRARDSVLANISHEFRTPLAAQLASIELLLDNLDTLSPVQCRELICSLQRSTHKLTHLIDNLLESVRIESGQLSIRHQSIAMAAVLEEATVLMGPLLTQRRQKLVMQLPSDLPVVNGDEVRLTQVCVNLLANANKFAPEDSTIYVGAQATDTHVTVWIEDEGPDLPEITCGTIFERFSRSPAQEPTPGGLGLGLWIVKSIIDRHAGSIRVQRTSTQRTRFSFSVPCAV